MDIKKLIDNIFGIQKQDTVYQDANYQETTTDISDFINNEPSVKQIENIAIPSRISDIKQPVFLSTCFDEFPSNDYIAYFKNGKLFNIRPRNSKIPLCEERQIAYQARYIVSDGVKYDLKNPDSICQIIIPKFNQIKGMPNVTFDLAYILKMRAGREYKPELTVPLIFKTVNLMLNSPIGWNKKDYFRLVIQLWHIGETFYADYLLEELNKRLPFMTDDDYYYKKSFKTALKNAKNFNHDYIISGHLGVICEKCAPFQDRIYSISGNDNRFPKLPKFILENCGLHCQISFFSTNYYKGKTITKYIDKNESDVVTKEVDAIKYSNRPFVDDRNIYAKNRYNNWLIKENQKKELDKLYYDRNHRINEYKLHLEYHQIVMLLQDKAPKSYSGYMRMKKNNTSNFQKIAKLAKENGIPISDI